jgi:hypothetical protein
MVDRGVGRRVCAAAELSMLEPAADAGDERCRDEEPHKNYRLQAAGPR